MSLVCRAMGRFLDVERYGLNLVFKMDMLRLHLNVTKRANLLIPSGLRGPENGAKK